MAQAETDVNLALYIGESFVEANLSRNQKSLHFGRWYLGKENFKSGLQKFFQESEVQKINQAIVASRFIEKILAYRLGGSVATLTTKGIENWIGIRQPQNPRVGQLSSSDLVFAVDERCNAQGLVEKEITDEEIKDLVEKLRQKQAKRVCIHFLNSHKNPHNQKKMHNALIQENFEVFIPSCGPESTDEVSRWRKNTLNASLSGIFEEVQEELNEGLKNFLPEGQRAQFISSENNLFDKENQHRLSSLWGAYGAWSHALKKQRKDKFNILYLGLEQFSLLNPEKQTQNWQGPWGKVDAPQIQNTLLSVQPTTSIEISPWGDLSFSRSTLGYEPGPMFMGRGQIPTLLDLWEEEAGKIKGLGDRRSPQGTQKFKNNLWALNKISAHKFDSEEKLAAYLRDLALLKLSMDITLYAEHTKIVCMGALASFFVKELKKRNPQHQFELLPETETSFLLNQGH